MDSQELIQLKVSLQHYLADNKIQRIMDTLYEKIPFDNPGRRNTLVLLKREFKSIEDDRLTGVRTETELVNATKRFVKLLLDFIQSLDVDDFNPVAPSQISITSAAKKRKTGSILYGIPSKMTVGVERQCIVRLAFDPHILLEDIEHGEDLKVKGIRRIGKRMEVQLVDPNQPQSFSFRDEFSTGIQPVEDNDFTEWTFFVTPLREGEHVLWLKAMIIILDENGEIRKDIVLKEKIEVVTEALVENLGVPLKHSGWIFTLGLPSVSSAAGSEEGADSTTTSPEPTVSNSAGFLSSMGAKIGTFVGVLALVIGAYFFFNPNNGENNQIGMEDTDQPKAVLTKLTTIEPVEALAPDFEVFYIDNRRDTTLEITSGSSVFIPANSIVHLDNAPVEDLVRIEVREIFEVSEIIGAGIPMRQFGVDGKENWMMTAGMIEILAFVQDRSVKLDDAHTLSYTHVSSVGDNYGFWYYDTLSGNWQQENTPVELSENEPERIDYQEEIRALRSELATPIQKKKVYEGFPFDYKSTNLDISCCPELKPKSGNLISFAFAGDNPKQSIDQNLWVLDESWIKKTIKSLGNGTYKLQFIGQNTFETTVMLAPDDPEALTKQYEKEYQEKLLQKKEWQSKLKDLMEKQADVINQNIIFSRSMELNGFGLYNFDIFLKQEDMLEVEAEFFVEGEPVIESQDPTYFLITGNNRSVIKFNKTTAKNFRFDPEMDNYLVTLLPNNRVALFSDEDFTAAIPEIEKNKDYTFQLRVLDPQEYSLANIDEILK